MENTNAVSIPLVDVLSELLGKRVVMGGEKYIEFDTLKEVSSADIRTAENIKALNEKEQKDLLIRDALMLAGKEYQGNNVSFTKEDADGVIQVKSAFEIGLQETIIHFKCGTKLPMKVEDFNDFTLWFMQERNKFFTGEYNAN